MREYIVNLTNNLIGKNNYDEIWAHRSRLGGYEGFLKHVKVDLENCDDVRNMNPETLGKIMCSFEIGDVMSSHPGREVLFTGDCEQLLRDLVATCLAYVIRDRLDPDRPTLLPPYKRQGNVSQGFKTVIDQLVQRRQDYLASLKTGQSIVKITYRGKQLTCVYVRHTQDTVTVQTSKEIIDHLFNNGTLCLSGPFTDMNVKFKLNEVQIANG